MICIICIGRHRSVRGAERWHRFGLQRVVQLGQTGAGRDLRDGQENAIEAHEGDTDAFAGV